MADPSAHGRVTLNLHGSPRMYGFLDAGARADDEQSTFLKRSARRGSAAAAFLE
jgi:hypothetical protein